MSSTLGVRVVFGVEVDSDSDAVCDFIMTKLISNDRIPQLMFDHFNEYYDHFVLGKGDEPVYDTFTDYYHYFYMVINHDTNDGQLGCFRQPCCLYHGWKSKLVIGVQLTHVQNLWLSPQGIDF